MRTAAITITRNRLELTKITLQSFYSKTKVDRHIFIDNDSTDGTLEYLKDKRIVSLKKNIGIAEAFKRGIILARKYDLILKLDNDIELVTEGLVEKVIEFYNRYGRKFVISPVDLLIDPKYEPAVLRREKRGDLDLRFTTHTGGACQFIPRELALRYAMERHVPIGDTERGRFYREAGFNPVYIEQWQMKHIGLNQSTQDYKL